MKSKVIQKKQAALIKAAKAMTPEERLTAFFNHSQLLARLYQAGVKSRAKKSAGKSRLEYSRNT